MLIQGFPNFFARESRPPVVFEILRDFSRLNIKQYKYAVLRQTLMRAADTQSLLIWSFLEAKQKANTLRQCDGCGCFLLQSTSSPCSPTPVSMLGRLQRDWFRLPRRVKTLTLWNNAVTELDVLFWAFSQNVLRFFPKNSDGNMESSDPQVLYEILEGEALYFAFKLLMEFCIQSILEESTETVSAVWENGRFCWRSVQCQ